MENKTIGMIVGAVILIIVGYMFYNSGPVVSAQGTSEIKVQPDLVSVNLNVETRNASLQLAQAKNSDISDRLIAELIKAGFSKDDLKFVNYNSYPEYDYNYFLPDGRPKEKGYIVSQQLVVKVSATDKVPKIVDAAINAGALVQYIQFEVSDEKQSDYKKQALSAASADAREKAKAIADGQGRHLGRLISINNQDFNYPGPIAYFDKAAVESSGASADAVNAEAVKVAQNINPQDIVVTATINAQYKLSFF